MSLSGRGLFTPPRAARARGVSIVEAMVALLVLSIGMLGIAALYLETVKANRTALIRTQAINLTNDLSDRIRANRFAQGSYALNVGVLPAAQGCVVANNCTAAELALDDLSRWVTAVRATLPASAVDGSPPTTQVVFAAAAAAGTPDQYTITVGWREPNETTNFTQNAIVRIVPEAP